MESLVFSYVFIFDEKNDEEKMFDFVNDLNILDQENLKLKMKNPP